MIGISFIHIKYGVSVIEEVDHARVVINPQKVHDESDHHVLLGFACDFILSRFTNSFKFHNLELLGFVQVLDAFGVVLNLFTFIIELVSKNGSSSIQSLLLLVTGLADITCL